MSDKCEGCRLTWASPLVVALVFRFRKAEIKREKSHSCTNIKSQKVKSPTAAWSVRGTYHLNCWGWQWPPKMAHPPPPLPASSPPSHRCRSGPEESWWCGGSETSIKTRDDCKFFSPELTNNMPEAGLTACEVIQLSSDTERKILNLP